MLSQERRTQPGSDPWGRSVGSVLVKSDLVGTRSLFVRMKARLAGEGSGVCGEPLECFGERFCCIAKFWRCSGRSWARLLPGQVPWKGWLSSRSCWGATSVSWKLHLPRSCSALPLPWAEAPPEALTGSRRGPISNINFCNFLVTLKQVIN